MWKPVVKFWMRSWRGDPPRIAHVAFADLALGSAYTLLVLVALTWRDSWVGLAMDQWEQLTVGAIERLFFFLPDPRSSLPPDIAARVLIYRHVMVACSIITVLCIAMSRQYWIVWSRGFIANLRRLGPPATRFPKMIATVHIFVVMGLAATIYLLLLAEPRNDVAVQFLYGHYWTFFRAPVLLAVICYFACHLAMLRPLLPTLDGE
jgi:hypothetical protein